MFKKLYKSLFVDDLLDRSSASMPAHSEPLKRKLIRELAKVTLFSYILLVFNPVIPVVGDQLAHAFWEKYHLLTVHEVNGRFHVHTEMAKAGTQSQRDKALANARSVVDGYAHLVSSISFDFSNNYFLKGGYSSYTISCLLTCPDSHYPPPKA